MHLLSPATKFHELRSLQRGGKAEKLRHFGQGNFEQMQREETCNFGTFDGRADLELLLRQRHIQAESIAIDFGHHFRLEATVGNPFCSKHQFASSCKATQRRLSGPRPSTLGLTSGLFKS